MKIQDYHTLFLDRDGVINTRPGDGYVTKWEEFHFLPGTLDALKKLTTQFRRIVVITNQQGVGKQLMSRSDLEQIHANMLEAVKNSGGYIDAVYYCTDLAGTPESCRKPGIAMAKMAQHDFPDIDLTKSIMAGDTATDMQFGRNAGMKTILIGKNKEDVDKQLVDFHFESLMTFAKQLSAND